MDLFFHYLSLPRVFSLASSLSSAPSSLGLALSVSPPMSARLSSLSLHLRPGKRGRGGKELENVMRRIFTVFTFPSPHFLFPLSLFPFIFPSALTRTGQSSRHRPGNALPRAYSPETGPFSNTPPSLTGAGAVKGRGSIKTDLAAPVRNSRFPENAPKPSHC